jgi:hypothetical protein
MVGLFQTLTGEKEEDVGGGEASDVGNMEVDGDGQLSKEALLAMSKIASMNVEPTREVFILCTHLSLGSLTTWLLLPSGKVFQSYHCV